MPKVTQKLIKETIDQELISGGATPQPASELLVFLLSQTHYYSKVSLKPDLMTSVTTRFRKGKYPYQSLNIHYDDKTVGILKSKLSLIGKLKTSSRLTPRQKNLELMRELIADQILEFRTEARSLAKHGVTEFSLCRLSGKKLAGCKVHVDHRITFSLLCKLWVKYETSFDVIEDIDMTKLGYQQSWVEFHRNWCLLDLTIARHNMAAGDKGQTLVP